MDNKHNIFDKNIIDKEKYREEDIVFNYNIYKTTCFYSIKSGMCL